MEKILIYNYLDYRAYLNDLFQSMKKNNPAFSYRVFARKAGFSSPSFLKLVITGARNLTKDSIFRFAKAFKLNGEEQHFFENLVFMNQSVTHEEKNFYYHKLSRTRGYMKIKKIEMDYFEYFSHWYNPAIRELATLKGGRITPEEIGKKIFPPIPLSAVKKSLELLIRLNLITKDKENRYQQASPYISTGPEVKSIMVKNYHLEAINLGSQAMENFPPEKRDVSAIIISLKEEQIKALKEEIDIFRKKLLSMGNTENTADTVMQINFQIFPLMKTEA